MNHRKCYLCGKKGFDRVKGKVRDIPDMPILKCRQCGLVFLANFDHISDTFYENALMRAGTNIRDYKRYLKECAGDDERRARMFARHIRGKAVLDFGCGSGGFLANIKGQARSCVGVEKDLALARTVQKESGIRIYSDVDEVEGAFDLITMFHVLEHFKGPREILARLSALLRPNGCMIIEVPNANDALLSLYESAAFSEFTYWGCHLFLFDEKTLTKVIQGAGLTLKEIKQAQRYPLSNHLYWLAKGRPGGHKTWDFMNDARLHSAYEAKLSQKKACDTIIALVGKVK